MKIKKTCDDAIIPQYQTPGSVGLDLHALEGGRLWPRERIVLDTGIAVQLDEGYEGQIRPRSGLSKRGIDVCHGSIDTDYRGEIKVCLVNNSWKDYTWDAGDRVAQLVISPIQRVTLEEVDELDDTERGTGGFGSTGR